MTYAAKTFLWSPGPGFGGANRLLMAMYPNGQFPGYQFIPAQTTPVLAFTDIISGPATGLGDGLGSGAIVTVWGWGFGTSQGSSQVYFTDSAGTKRAAAHVYYWKAADGQAPSGPSNLYESHLMQEIAFSIPSGSASGAGTITVETTGGVSNTLPFTVRAGNIYWAAPSGTNSNPGTYASPKAFVNGNINPSGNTGGYGDGNLVAGDIVYSMGVTEPTFSSGGIECGMYLRGLNGTPNSDASQQIAIVAYPGAHSTVTSHNRGINPYITTGIVISKYALYVGSKLASDTTIDAGNSTLSTEFIGTTYFGRVIGNYFSEPSGYVVNGWSGTISSGGQGGDGVVAYGNHADRLGNDYTSHFWHVTYMSVRSQYTNTNGWDLSYNYFNGCKGHDGIHYYDESQNSQTPNVTGPIRANYNVIVDQRSAGIAISCNGAGVTTTLWNPALIEVVGNVLVRCGIGVQAEPNNGISPQGIRIGGDMAPSQVIVDSNMTYGISTPQSRGFPNSSLPFHLTVDMSTANPTVQITNNLFYDTQDIPYFYQNSGSATTIDTADNNALFTDVSTPVNAVAPPGWTNTKTTDPKLYLIGNGAVIDSASPLKSTASASKVSTHNVYGVSTSNVGAV